MISFLAFYITKIHHTQVRKRRWDGNYKIEGNTYQDHTPIIVVNRSMRQKYNEVYQKNNTPM